MNKTDKIIIIFYVFLASSFGLYVFTYDTGLSESMFEVVIPKQITEFETSRLVDVPNNRIFNVMADIEKFPDVIPKNVISVNILDKTDNVITAEEELYEKGIKTKLLVKHTINPYSEHIIEIIDGDAEGTTITQYFEPVGSQTKLTTNVNLNVKGVTSIVSFLPKSNLVSAVNTVISNFVEYSEFDDYDIIVNALYVEILNRTVDAEGLSHYSSLLRDGQITERDLRSSLLNSEEYRLSQMEWKTIDELNEETINVINDLYEKILLREVDPEGLQHFGNLFERGTTSDEIRTLLLESDEGQSISLTNPVRTEIITMYRLLFDKHPKTFEVDHYHKLVDVGLILNPDWAKNILSWGQATEVAWYEVANSFRFLYNEGIVFPDDRQILPKESVGYINCETIIAELKKSDNVLGESGAYYEYVALSDAYCTATVGYGTVSSISPWVPTWDDKRSDTRGGQ